MWNLDRRMWKEYMQRSNQKNPNTVLTKMNSIAYNQKILEKKESVDNKYKKIPNMNDALLKVRTNKSTLNLNLVNATSSRTKR